MSEKLTRGEVLQEIMLLDELLASLRASLKILKKKKRAPSMLIHELKLEIGRVTEELSGLRESFKLIGKLPVAQRERA